MTTDLPLIFSTIKDLMRVYSPPLLPKKDEEAYYDLWSFRTLVIEGRKRKEIYFAGVVRYATYVGFYYMPVYAEPEMKTVFAPELLALLKGKSCFHVKKLDEQRVEHIRTALETGFKTYQERGWV